ncbi:Nucleoside-diphosphate-sugar epimerase [Halopseudomonas xinjiangensis]|uniref:Nucleoside-diphosphate-sugar epimerase n=1 Tax=Halopseudomonas xinjiangensis TaxID=487184 RepID=A0A1H1NPC3_9GAMM|nr:NAD(P)-dependent oxidoreductase [Halopseudomonas xinjiangensis]SDS00881.1 Nucleoside-diphosphate-sugar epimerase [Halopseudomonas xinjiangensis]
MVVGRGLLATAFALELGERDDLIVFASGAANSKGRDAEAFLRERRMLEECTRQGRRLVYFGTCSVHDPELHDSPYTQHKLRMEELAKQSARYAIFRLPQVVGPTQNQHTLTNYVRTMIMSGQPFTVWRGARRNIIDVTDVARIAHVMLDDAPADSCFTVNIANPRSIAVTELVHTFETVLGKKGTYTVVEGGGAYEIDTSRSSEAAVRAGINFDTHYVENVLRKYYGK